MAKKDYVNRRPAPKKKKKGRKSHTKANSNHLWCYLFLFFFIIIIGIIVWGKFHTTTSQRTEVIPAKPEHSKVELPSRPEIEWSYIKQLETREVPIDNTHSLTKNSQLRPEQQKILQQLMQDGGKAFQTEKKTNTQKNVRYTLQCGAFKNKEQAESLQAQLAFNGLVSKVKNSANWYRVFAGPYESKSQAETKQAQVKNLANCVIVGI
ncbi:hypothetical protein CEP48_07010 [Mergibacter septicus]|uniref:SPOR domain-containing protein n=1 Tax=Mergibacter septicus TaxID=221402 RepID=A0A8E3MDV0_9PAST|nr:SPOR domain-containing protein [Mergibacter septicus]QDJ13419.1 hypothetical protein CEP45_05930 [Mergibacter septicus]QDJ15196.1 hypothetical protein CEP48_07010 [Mergibacter septicus]